MSYSWPWLPWSWWPYFHILKHSWTAPLLSRTRLDGPQCIGVTAGLHWREPGRHSICMGPHALFPPWLLHSYTTVSWFIPTIHQNCLFLSICIVGFIRIIHILVKTVWHNMSINQRLFAYWHNTVATQWSSMFWGPVIQYALIYCPEINRFRSSGSYAWFT